MLGDVSMVIVTYDVGMKRLQIMIDEDLDEALGLLALRERTSKAALIRRYVRQRVDALPPLDADPIAQMIGADDFEPGGVDDVVYR